MDISIQAVLLRLLTAMLIGMIVGSERERSHRPAGLRTHMLVALGACVIMITGMVMWHDYTALGGSPDPARLAAQVIPGVGFLGAGTILREGFSIKGLTTAASLWATACMGLCAGAGFYAAALTCAAAVFVTLTIFEVLQQRMLGKKGSILIVKLVCSSATDALEGVRQLSQRYSATLEDVEYRREDGIYHVTFHARFTGTHQREIRQKFLYHLGPATGATRLDTLIEAPN
ncbi:MAG: MgtC/SapB family protein [Butyricicoccus sp.]|nr:MgtC/SapB family protein [Butyricicoccus sp.]